MKRWTTYFDDTWQRSRKPNGCRPNDPAEYQRGLLRELVRHAQSECPFYSERLSCLFTGSGIDLSHWSDVPILTVGRSDGPCGYDAGKARA